MKNIFDIANNTQDFDRALYWHHLYIVCHHFSNIDIEHNEYIINNIIMSFKNYHCNKYVYAIFIHYFCGGRTIWEKMAC